MTFSLDPAAVVQLCLSVVLPVLVGFVTTRSTNGNVKATLLAALTLVASLLTELGRAQSSGQVYDLGAALLSAIPAFAISVATQFGLWRPSGVTSLVQDVGPKPRRAADG